MGSPALFWPSYACVDLDANPRKRLVFDRVFTTKVEKYYDVRLDLLDLTSVATRLAERSCVSNTDPRRNDGMLQDGVTAVLQTNESRPKSF